MKQAQKGDTVRVHYKGTLVDGTEFDSSEERGPIDVEIGGGRIIPGFEEALVGMSQGETKSVTIEPEQAYGQHSPELMHKVERARVPANIDLEVGLALQASDQEGNPLNLVVVDFDEATVTLDANHPLAGEELSFELEIVEIVDEK